MKYFMFHKIQNQAINKLLSSLIIKDRNIDFHMLDQNQGEKIR